MGMHGAVLAGDADLTAGPSPLEERFQRELHMPPASIDSHLVMVSGMRKAFINRTETFTKSFGTYVWICLFVSLIAMITLMNIYDSLILRRPFVFMRSLGYGIELIRTLLTGALRMDFDAPYSRILGCVWLLSAFILAESFAGQSRASLIVRAPTERIDTVWDLVAHRELKSYVLGDSQIGPWLNSLPGPRGAALKHHMELNALPRPVSEMFTDEVREELGHKKSMIFTDLQAAMQAVYRWCVETNYYFYISSDQLLSLDSTWYTSRRLDRSLIEAMDRQIMWSRAYGLKYVRDHELYRGSAKCIPSNRLEQSDEAKSTTLLDLESVFETFFYTTMFSIITFVIELLCFKRGLILFKYPVIDRIPLKRRKYSKY
ncbi:hypothetical protein BIW11_01798 [Tropilaelaps mercedesae]|uniref:Ionotropic glutamate receptor C-terminal domain-containing protein n=1 Tax=Tropilaelaps mercedesae TaxID=418985 RepID=A0A1V9X8U0_9ACAR|nr:hypothetical protein BIW11_01798 [Tropilaelaps mercedesae]